MWSGIIFLIYSVSFAQVQLGFLPKDSAFIPTAVHASGDKIFKITMPYYISVQENEYNILLEAPKIPQNTKDAILACKNKNIKTCISPFSEINSTAFLGKTPDTLWTNCHIVNTWMMYAGRNKVFTKSSEVRAFFASENIPLELRNRNGQAVFAPTSGATLKAFAAVANFPNVDSGCNVADDMVKITLSYALAKDGIAWASSPSANVFMGGFPRTTDSRTPLGFDDSDGKSFYWTAGPWVDKESDEGKVFLEPHKDSLFLGGPFIEYHRADGVEGMSGSPVLNEKGELLGIYKGYVPLSETQKDIPFVSLFFNNGGMRYLEILSGE